MLNECGEYPLPALTFEDQQRTPGSSVAVLPRAGNPELRSEILGLEAEIKKFLRETDTPEPDLPLTHHFAPGAYGRQIFIPKDTLVVGKIHKHAHLNMVMQGNVTVGTEDGVAYIQAPAVFVSNPGTKRVVYAHEDTLWVTVHVTDSQDLDVIEDQIIAKTFEEFDALQGIDTRCLLQAIAQKEGAVCPGQQ